MGECSSIIRTYLDLEVYMSIFYNLFDTLKHPIYSGSKKCLDVCAFSCNDMIVSQGMEIWWDYRDMPKSPGYWCESEIRHVPIVPPYFHALTHNHIITRKYINIETLF
jgi:hypothetical protein